MLQWLKQFLKDLNGPPEGECLSEFELKYIVYNGMGRMAQDRKNHLVKCDSCWQNVGKQETQIRRKLDRDAPAPA